MKIINIVSDYQYIFDDGKVVKEELSKQKGIVTSFLYPKNLFSVTKKFDKNLSEETILLEMEKYVYSYPGIDINKDYKSIFLEIERENNKIIEAILVETSELENIFSKALEVYKYIDFISPSFLAWKEYYNLTKIDPKNDIFIYFGEEDAFLSGFSNGEYLFHKSLNKFNTLEKLLNKSRDEVIELLKTKGLDISQYENNAEFSVIDKFFSEFFLKVFNIMNFSLNEYQVPKFERIIFYSPFEIKGLFEQYENYWNLNGIEFKKSNLSTEYDHLEYLITIFNANNYENEEINLSIFSKPPSIFKTKAGKFLLFVIVTILLVAGYAGYEIYYISSLDSEINKLEKRYLILKKRHALELKVIEKYKKENKKLKVQIKDLNKQIQDIGLKVDTLYEKAKEPLFYNVLARVANSMKKYSLKASSLTKNGAHIEIIIVSDFDNTKEVTSFMNDLIDFNYKNVKVTYISNNDNNYISKVDFDYE